VGRLIATIALLALALPALGEEGRGPQADPQAVQRLSLVVASDSSFKVRATAAVALGRLQDPRALSTLTSALQTDPHFAVRAAAAMALGRLPNSGAVPPLIDALHDSDPLVREQAGEALTAFHRPEHLPAFERALVADDVRRRRAAVTAFGEALRAGHEPAAMFVLGALGDDDAAVRDIAERALITLGHERAVPVLLRGLSYVSTPVRAAAATLLSRRADERAVAPLVEALRRTEESDEVRAAICLALRAHREYLEVGALLARAGDKALGSSEARLDAIRVAAALGGTSARRVLLAALIDDDKAVRAAAARAAPDLGAELARPLLEAALAKEQDPRVKRQFELVLRVLR
jgi:HEAT repeat protein